MRLNCPCGIQIEAPDEDALVELARQHLLQAHPGRTYTRDQILFFADE